MNFKRLMKRATAVLAIVTAVMAFAGCGKEVSIVGEWVCDDYTFVFNEDGTGSENRGGINVQISSYEFKDGVLTLTVSILGTEETDEYDCTLEDDKMTLDDGISTREFTRQ